MGSQFMKTQIMFLMVQTHGMNVEKMETGQLLGLCVRWREDSPVERKSTAWTGSPQSSAGSAPGPASQPETTTETHSADKIRTQSC